MKTSCKYSKGILGTSVVAQLFCGCALWAAPVATDSTQTLRLASPNCSVMAEVRPQNGVLDFGVQLNGAQVLEPSPLHFAVDGTELTAGAEMGPVKTTDFGETYPWNGVHSRATNAYHEARIPLLHKASGVAYTLEIRVFNDAAAFRFVLPADKTARVPDETSTFLLPAGSTVWSHDLGGHYEALYTNQPAAALKPGQWLAPPVTFKLPGRGYASLTEAALANYSGMALQAQGSNSLGMRLGHAQPPSYPFRLRYSAEDVQRLSKAAAIDGTITTPWRVVMMGPDLNALVNCDAVHNLCPPPDPKLFRKGARTDWVQPGRAVWKYLDGGGSNSLATMKQFTDFAWELGFEYHVLEGFWSRWSDQEIKDLVAFAKRRNVKLLVWKHSKSLREPEARHEFFKRCHELGLAGAKIDFFDHEAKEMVDLYQSLLREAAEYKLVLVFHGANKPTGESRTWPNELTREAVKGMESRRLEDRATHDVTLPFTRLLAGPADYTPMHFGERRGNTTLPHQVASAAIFGGPLLTYAANPSAIWASPYREVIKAIPPVWDETIVLSPSEIGEVAAFARRSGDVWFVAVMNGNKPRSIDVPLSFLSPGEYLARIVRDVPDAPHLPELQAVLPTQTWNVNLDAGGGFVARIVRRGLR